MAIQKKLIHFKKLESFQEQLDSNNILDTSIVFIQDAKLIWTHGQYYGSIDEIQTQLDDLIDEVEKNELVTAAGLVDLEDRKADREEVDSKIDDVSNLVQKLITNTELRFFCIKPVDVIVNGETTTYDSNTLVYLALNKEDDLEIVPSENDAIMSLTSYPGALGTFYDWLEGVQVFDGILFDMNSVEMYQKWNQGHQGQYHVQFAQYLNCVFWSDNSYISEISTRTNYTLYYSSQLPLCYSTIPDNTFKAFYSAYGVTSDPNWSNPTYRDSFAKATHATQVFSYYGLRTIGVFDMDSSKYNIVLPKDCRGLMFGSQGIENAGVFDATNVTNFGANSGSWREAFGYCTSLRNLYIKNLKVSLNLSWSEITIDSLSTIISKAANTSAITIYLSPYTYYRLTEDIRSEAASKNISLTLVETNYVEDPRISQKADKSTTLSGYGIEDAKIENGTITLGENTITPLTEIPNASEIEISEAFTETVYPKESDPDVVFTPTKIGDSIETSVGNIESTISNLITATLDSEKVVAAALTDLGEKKADKDSLGDYFLRDEANGSVIIVSEDYQALEENYGDLDLTPVTPGSTVDSAFSIIEGNLSKISEVIIEDELVTATSIINLEKKLDESLNTLTGSDVTVGDSFPALSKFEGYLELTPITAGITLDQALSTIENNFNIISKDLEESDITIASSLTDLEERKAEKADLENYLTTDAANGSIISISENYPVIEEYADGGELKLTPVSENSTLDEAIFTLDSNISDISKIILDNELVTASSLTDLDNRKANKEDFETFSNEIESKILELYEEVSENEEVTAAALVDLDSRKVEKSDLDNYLLLENATGAKITLSNSYVPSEYPENTGDTEFQAVESNETVDSAISKLDKNISTLVQAILDIEEVTAASCTELNDKKLDAELLPDHYSEDPQIEYKKLGGNNVYEKFFSLTYTTPGTEAIWELPCTEENSMVTVLEMNCILQQVLEGEGTISFDYRDQYLFGDNANILKYYYKHSSGSLIIKFTSNKTTTLTGLIKFSSSNVIAAGDSSTVSDEEVLDGGTSA